MADQSKHASTPIASPDNSIETAPSPGHVFARLLKFVPVARPVSKLLDSSGMTTSPHLQDSPPTSTPTAAITKPVAILPPTSSTAVSSLAAPRAVIPPPAVNDIPSRKRPGIPKTDVAAVSPVEKTPAAEEVYQHGEDHEGLQPLYHVGLGLCRPEPFRYSRWLGRSRRERSRD